MVILPPQGRFQFHWVMLGFFKPRNGTRAHDVHSAKLSPLFEDSHELDMNE